MKLRSLSRYALTFLLLASALWLVACNSTDSTVSQGVKIEPPTVQIEKGMSAEDIIEAMGEPSEIRPADSPAEGMEIWVYRKVNENVSLVVSGTQKIPAVNPITGQETFIVDDVYSQQTSRFTEETLLLMVDGVMTAWKVKRSNDQSVF